MEMSCDFVNKKRKKHSLFKSTDKQLKRRKILRHNSKKKQDKNIDLEGPSYGYGAF